MSKRDRTPGIGNMAHYNFGSPTPDLNLLLSSEQYDMPFWKSLLRQVQEKLHPEKLPPLHLTSKPVPVRDIWGAYNYKKRGAIGSTVIHTAVVAGIIAASVLGARVVKQVEKHETVTLVAPDISDYMPLSNKKNDTIGGGGGGGDRDKIQAPKGRLPKLAMEQITPPAMVIRNEHPKLAVEPTVVVPPQVKLPQIASLNLGDPKAVIPTGPMSNGTGSGGGIGSGSGGGVGSSEGPGVGPGRGGGIGGGVFKVGGGVSAPRALSTPDPEYSEEARKAKYQGTVVLWLIVDQNGHPQQVRVARSLGMGLDQKAIEAVKQWKFEPAMKDGKPVAVQI
ncbi:MAG TPA: energy transducer TonB, partial [Gemmatimonadales bacterium]|nr:energy transducer TonB [Gemmatimonadales bacterium]